MYAAVPLQQVRTGGGTIYGGGLLWHPSEKLSPQKNLFYFLIKYVENAVECFCGEPARKNKHHIISVLHVLWRGAVVWSGEMEVLWHEVCGGGTQRSDMVMGSKHGGTVWYGTWLRYGSMIL